MRRVDGVLVVLAVQGSLFQLANLQASVMTLERTPVKVKPLQPALQCTRPTNLAYLCTAARCQHNFREQRLARGCALPHQKAGSRGELGAGARRA